LCSESLKLLTIIAVADNYISFNKKHIRIGFGTIDFKKERKKRRKERKIKALPICEIILSKN